MKPANLLFILSDEHSRRVLGCYGHPMIRTPNPRPAGGARRALHRRLLQLADLRAVARQLSRPAATSHDIRFWDNAIAYDGSVPSWHHRLRGGRATRSPRSASCISAARDDDNGFTEEIMPLHVVDGIGDPLGLLRDPLPVRKAALRLARRRRPRQFELPGLRRPHHRGGGRLAEGAGRASHERPRTSPGCCSCRWSARISR